MHIAALVDHAHATFVELLRYLALKQPFADYRGYPELQILSTS
jgi:hypothetical protein